MSELTDVLISHEEAIHTFVENLAHDIKKSPRMFTAGNGGSAAIASHLVADIMKTTCRFDMPSVICLTDNVPLLTALSNDVSYLDALSEAAFLHHVGAEDLVVIVSSSGNSANVVNLARRCLHIGASVHAMVGFTGGQLFSMVGPNRCLHIKSNDYGVVEDAHHHVIHRLVRSLLVEFR